MRRSWVRIPELAPSSKAAARTGRGFFRPRRIVSREKTSKRCGCQSPPDAAPLPCGPVVDDDARRVLIVIESTIGGTRLNLRIVTEELVACGKSVAIAYAARREKAFMDDVAIFRSMGVECVEIPMRRAPSPVSDLRAIFSLRRLAGRFRPDVLHLISSKAGLVGRVAAIGLGVRVQYAPHCFAFKSDSPLRHFYALAERLLVPLTDTLVAVCGSEADDARRIGYTDDRIKVVPNHLPAAYAPRRRASPHGGRTAVAFIGRNARQKGVDILLAAYCMLGGTARRGFDLHVMSDLSPDMRKAFEGLGAVVHPYGSHDDAMALLSRCDVLAMPSRWEASPYLVLEALAAGLFVVAHDVGGIGEMIGDGGQGLLYEGDGPDALAEALAGLTNGAVLP